MNVQERLKKHLNDLKNNKHHNHFLQRDFNVFGENNFESTILELVRPSLLNRAESEYCYNYDVWYSGYNIQKLYDYRQVPLEDSFKLGSAIILKLGIIIEEALAAKKSSDTGNSFLVLKSQHLQKKLTRK